MGILQFRSISSDESEAKAQVKKGLLDAINDDKFVVFEGALSKFDKNWFFRCFQDSGIVKTETTRVDFNTLKKIDEAWWEIRYDPKNDGVYKHSKTRQPLHTDNSFLTQPPKISLFAMERQVSEGGETTLLPLSELIVFLKLKEPELLELLSGQLYYISKGDEVQPNITPIINLQTSEINWNYYRTEKRSKEQEYAVEKFHRLLEELENDNKIYVQKFNSGDVYMFNDLKYLHARKAFNAGTSGQRLLCHSMWHHVEGV